MKTIIIPTDFSSAATNAVNYGLNMALTLNAEVLLFHVYSIPITVVDAPVMLISVDELEKNAQKQMNSLRDDVSRITGGKVHVRTETKLGDIIDELEKLCESVQPFAIIMASANSSGLERALFGSNTISAIRRLTWPVIAVPPGKEYGKGIHKIGFACDIKNVAETAPTGVIKNLVKQFKGELHVLNVSQHQEKVGIDEKKELTLLQTMLEEVDPVYDFIQNDNVEEGLNEFAEKNNLDLLIVIPKKHKGIESIFKKHATKQLVMHSHIPVMCIHESD
jgi:nucleotide-binding universal stress UspA family protein